MKNNLKFALLCACVWFRLDSFGLNSSLAKCNYNLNANLASAGGRGQSGRGGQSGQRNRRRMRKQLRPDFAANSSE